MATAIRKDLINFREVDMAEHMKKTKQKNDPHVEVDKLFKDK